jgi:2-polyprenyl-6-methoxyphenol hydroxylase-like FAD-dependent oxidoreductase
VVVGAGPAGLAVAATLARGSVNVLVLSRHSGVSPQPRATVLSLRTMEFLRSWGLEDQIWAGGDDVEWQMLVARTLAEAGRGHRVDVGYPTVAVSARLSPTRPAAVPQDHLESVLLRHLCTQPTVQVRRSVVVEQVSPDGSGWKIDARDLTTGESLTVWSDYLVGADGPRSRVRDRLGIGLDATVDLMHAVSVVFHGPLWEVVGSSRFGIYNVIGGAAWVTSMMLIGYFLGAFAAAHGFALDKHIEKVIIVVVLISILPGIISFLKNRRAKPSA